MPSAWQQQQRGHTHREGEGVTTTRPMSATEGEPAAERQTKRKTNASVLIQRKRGGERKTGLVCAVIIRVVCSPPSNFSRVLVVECNPKPTRSRRRRGARDDKRETARAQSCTLFKRKPKAPPFINRFVQTATPSLGLPPPPLALSFFLSFVRPFDSHRRFDFGER